MANRYCEDCGAELTEGKKFCGECGAEVAVDTSGAEPLLAAADATSDSSTEATGPGSDRTGIVLSWLCVGLMMLGWFAPFVADQRPESSYRWSVATSLDQMMSGFGSSDSGITTVYTVAALLSLGAAVLYVKRPRHSARAHAACGLLLVALTLYAVSLWNEFKSPTWPMVLSWGLLVWMGAGVLSVALWWRARSSQVGS